MQRCTVPTQPEDLKLYRWQIATGNNINKAAEENSMKLHVKKNYLKIYNKNRNNSL